MPALAAPTPVATMAASEIGASKTRPGPTASTSPVIWAQWPPRWTRSVPKTKMSGVRAHLLGYTSGKACRVGYLSSHWRPSWTLATAVLSRVPTAAA